MIDPVSVLAILAFLGFLYFASPILIPLALAMYLNLLLSPLVTTLEKIRIPAALSSAFIVLGLFGLLIAAANLLAEPAEEWVEKAPKTFLDVQRKILPFTQPLEEISELAETVDEITAISESSNIQKVEVKPPNLFSRAAEQIPTIALSVTIVLFLTYFLLSAGDSFLRKFVSLGYSFRQKRRILTIVRTIQKEVSVYLVTITIINTGLGIAVAITMHYLGVPNPLLWGALATVLNFIPYMGAIVMALIMLMVGLATFSLPAAIFAPVLSYAGLSVIEGNLVTPSLVGRNLKLQPAIVFLMLIAWGWMWGVVGALLSIPITVAIKVILQKLPEYRYLSMLMQR